MHAAQAGIQKLSPFRKTVQRIATATWALSDNSDGGTDTEGYSTDRYTNGSLASDEDNANFDMRQDAEIIPVTRNEGSLDTGATIGPASSSSQFVIPGPGSSEGDCAQLVSMCPPSTGRPGVRSILRKKRRMLSKPGKVMKPAYFKGIQWSFRYCAIGSSSRRIQFFLPSL